MIVKPSLSQLSKDSDSQLIVDVETIIANMDGNPAYPNPNPTLAVLIAAKTDFVTALANAANGGIELTAIKNDQRAALIALLRDSAAYVQVACNGDLTLLLSSGFPIQKPQRFPVGPLPAPVVSAGLGTQSGELDAAAVPVFGAAIYNWRLTKAESPTVILQSAQTTAASNSFVNLTPGTAYVVQANAVGAAGPSDWSQAVTQMVI